MSIYLINLAITLLLAVLKVVCLLVAIAYFTLAERKIMAAVQRRVGPNVVGPFGLLQPLADGLKLAGKELAVPAQASSRIFLSVAITVLLFALSGWTVIPFGMFDHSEHMSNSEVVNVLINTDDALSLECSTRLELRNAYHIVRAVFRVIYERPIVDPVPAHWDYLEFLESSKEYGASKFDD